MAERSLKLEIRDMTKRYDNGDGVEHINLKIYEGEIVTMLGPSGCGKSTILRTIGGFLDVTDGDILIDNESIVKLPPEKRPTAMVFQSYNLWTHMTVYENLAFGLKLRKIPKDQIRADIDKHLKLVSMSGFEKKYPTQLSGGQQQRIAIARSLLLKPSVLLLDEPFSALDAKIRQQMEFFAQTADMKGGRSLNLLNISVHFICGLCDSVVQFTGLRIIASGRKKEHIVSWRNKEDRLTMEENLQPPILYIG